MLGHRTGFANGKGVPLRVYRFSGEDSPACTFTFRWKELTLGGCCCFSLGPTQSHPAGRPPSPCRLRSVCKTVWLLVSHGVWGISVVQHESDRRYNSLAEIPSVAPHSFHRAKPRSLAEHRGLAQSGLCLPCLVFHTYPVPNCSSLPMGALHTFVPHWCSSLNASPAFSPEQLTLIFPMGTSFSRSLASAHTLQWKQEWVSHLTSSVYHSSALETEYQLQNSIGRDSD